MTTHAGARTVSPNRVIGAVFGAIYVLVGLVGFAITTSTAFVATSGPDLIIFGKHSAGLAGCYLRP